MNSINQLRKKQVKCIKYIIICAVIFTATIFSNGNLFAQNVAVTDDSTYVPKASAILDVKATNKGMLIPRVSLTSTSSASPVTSPDSSLMVYNKATAGDVTPGYYYWSGSKWIRMANGEGRLNTVTKTANATLAKTETMVLASNDITLTLPVVTPADDGLAITVKNMGTYTDLITVIGNGASTIDDKSNSTLTRWKGRTFIADDGNWVIKDRENRADNILEVTPNGSWTSISEVIEYLNIHMDAPAVIRLGGELYEIATTQVINLPFPVTIQGMSYGATTIAAATGLAGSPMFSCVSDCYFKMLSFDGSALAGYGNAANENAIHYIGSGSYNEVKDCDFVHFNKAILSSTDAELWIFETDFEANVVAGLEIANATGATKFTISETDFTNCGIGINLKQGVNEVLSIMNCGFYCNAGGQIGINYVPATFAPFTSMFITNNTWNNTGTFIQGFDLTRSDGRDANAFIQNNAGIENKNPRCKINVRNNASTTTLTTAANWYKVNWTNTSSTNCNFCINNNKITYLPANRRGLVMIITGNLTVNNANRTISIGIVKNGVSGTRYGEADLRVTVANQPFQFSTVIYVDDVGPGDYFEFYSSSLNSGDIVTFQDVQWFTESK
jgi:hypothetical protein